ncbi:hypothetical protein [Arsukibacterium sp.]|uniref:hypothetical protein n=1 Tax=Arsukibacterium sp. TaxID=1977258 RepID=UPI00299E0B14|nr:hypothetical protein [Arsukibacterium sp.]MDX1537033.1 hypothetical protein [Arsukibacterium sp.]
MQPSVPLLCDKIAALTNPGCPLRTRVCSGQQWRRSGAICHISVMPAPQTGNYLPEH